MGMLRGQSACAKLKGVDLVYVGSIGGKSARPGEAKRVLSRLSGASGDARLTAVTGKNRSMTCR